MKHTIGFFVVVVSAFAAPQADAFRFLCNGIDADGSTDSDGCGACSASSAARWEEFQVDFRFDDNVRPSEVTLAEWQANQTATIANWNNVQGHGLTLRDVGATSFREFGDINGENSIFWITSSNEFNQKVGGGAGSILGVTLAPYNCGGARRGGIEDADIVMNGTDFDGQGGFDWNENSVVSTMVHEMGHGIGFGHPCSDCADFAIMSATAGFVESDTPLLDDEDAIRSLYPGEPGGIGTACSVDGDCDANKCVTANISGTNRSFCSQTCTADANCSNGMICGDVNGEGRVCVFSNAGIADVGETCGPPGCIDECDGFDIQAGCNVCLGECFAGCVPSTGAGCGANEVCSQFSCSQNNQCTGGLCSGGVCQDDIGVCLVGGTALRGQPCDDAACTSDVTCVTDGNGNNGICRGLCNAAGQGCLTTENCLFLFGNSTQGACFPVGVKTEGQACSDVEECARGLLCTGTCEQRCDRGFECADVGQGCNASGFTNSGMNTCGDRGGEGEGEGGEGEGEEGEGEDECDVDRGNFDCPAGSSCDGGACVDGEGPRKNFELCADNSECAGGLCVNGVCTRPCDVVENACPPSYTCDTGAIPGGLCVPGSCFENEAVCEKPEFTCEYSSAQRYVCAKGAGGFCNCSATHNDGRSTPLPGIAMVALVGGLLARRPRRVSRGG
jgi:MYXO-CTERM domain-containing protein